MCILSGFINIETAAHLWKGCNSTGLTVLHNVFAHKQQGDVIYGTHVCHRGLETPAKECLLQFSSRRTERCNKWTIDNSKLISHALASPFNLQKENLDYVSSKMQRWKSL